MNIHSVFAQVPGIDWEYCYGGTSTDVSNGSLHLKDGSLIVLGSIYSNDGMTVCNHGKNDIWIAKLDSMGILLWRKCIGGSNDDWAESIILCRDNGFLICGRTNSNDGDISGYHIFGHFENQDCLLIKLDSLGSIQWQHCFGGSQSDQAIAAVQLLNGDFIFTGSTNSYDGDVNFNHDTTNYTRDLWLVKVDSIGNLIWNYSFGSTQDDYPTDIKIKNNSELYLLGATSGNNGDVLNNHGSYDIWWLDIDTGGNIIRQKCYGGSSQDIGSSIFTDSLSTWILGSTTSTDGDITINYGSSDCFLIRIDSTGSILNKKIYGGTDSDEAISLLGSSNGFYFILNSYSDDGDFNFNHWIGPFTSDKSDIWIVKCNTNGQILWKKNLGGSSSDRVNSLLITNNYSTVVVGATYSNDGDVSGQNGMSDIWLVKLSETVRIDNINSEKLFNIFPNPSNGNFHFQLDPLFPSGNTVSFILIDIQGKEIDRQILKNRSFNYQNKELNPGLYIFKIISTNQFPITGKILITQNNDH